VVGAHWQSDTDAARLAASAAYARLHTSDRFLEQMKKAREEYKRLKGESTPVQSARVVSMTSDRAYTLQGTPVTAGTRGIVIQNQQKVVVK
jgi:acid phosphatase (class A)